MTKKTKWQTKIKQSSIVVGLGLSLVMLKYLVMTKISEALDQYTGICKEAMMTSVAKLSKSFEKVIIEVLLLYMVIPGRINFTQLGKYGRHGEQCYRQNFGRLRSKSLNWLRFNVSLALRYFGSDVRKAIAIDPSYISKAGKKTPHIGRF